MTSKVGWKRPGGTPSRPGNPGKVKCDSRLGWTAYSGSRTDRYRNLTATRIMMDATCNAASFNRFARSSFMLHSRLCGSHRLEQPSCHCNIGWSASVAAFATPLIFLQFTREGHASLASTAVSFGASCWLFRVEEGRHSALSAPNRLEVRADAPSAIEQGLEGQCNLAD